MLAAILILSLVSASLAAAADDGIVSLKNHGHQNGVQYIAMSRDGTRLLTSGRYNEPTIVVWDVPTGKKLRTLKAEFGCDGLFVLPDGKSGGWLDGYERELVLVNLDTGERLKAIRLGIPIEDHGMTVDLSRDGTLLAVGTGSLVSPDPKKPAMKRFVKVFEVSSGTCLHSFEVETGVILHVEFSGDARTLIAGGKHRGILRWDLKEGKAMPTLGAQDAAHFIYLAQDCSISRDGTLVATATLKDLVVWDSATGAVKRAIPLPKGFLTHRTGFSPDGRFVFLAGTPRMIWVYEVATGKNVKRLDADAKGVAAVCTSADGLSLGVGGLAYLKVCKTEILFK